jgi:hypothetical protein
MLVIAWSGRVVADTNISTAENLIDAFYSFDASRLEATLEHAEDSAPSILYYQGWAEGGNWFFRYRYVFNIICRWEDHWR